jgi:hypothetical protein
MSGMHVFYSILTRPTRPNGQMASLQPPTSNLQASKLQAPEGQKAPYQKADPSHISCTRNFKEHRGSRGSFLRTTETTTSHPHIVSDRACWCSPSASLQWPSWDSSRLRTTSTAAQKRDQVGPAGVLAGREALRSRLRPPKRRSRWLRRALPITSPSRPSCETTLLHDARREKKAKVWPAHATEEIMWGCGQRK